jgi:phosphopantothenoylcysteine decarboxylase/phosphopantothenate--cysteine ligase
MPEPEQLFNVIMSVLGTEQDMGGLSMLVTAGATQEAMDPVRFITNHSTGKMGAAIAREAAARGAHVTYIKASTSVPDPEGCDVVSAVSAAELCDAVTGRAESADIIVMAAAVADYRPKTVSSDKMKKKDGELTLELERTTDILAELGKRRASGELPVGQYICGFSMETKDLIENSRAKLEKKNCDMIVANNLKEQGAGFGHDTNKVTLITKDGNEELELMSKQDVAKAIIDRILDRAIKKL